MSGGGGDSAQSITDSRLAALCAQKAEEAFLDYQERFHAITRRARNRFLQRDWTGSYADAAERLHLYPDVLGELTAQIRTLMGSRLEKHSVWVAIKAVYSSVIAQRSEWEVAETFFNSLTRRVFATAGVDQAIEFVDTDFDAPPAQPSGENYRVYSGSQIAQLLFSALTDPAVPGFAEASWADLQPASQLAAKRIETATAEWGRFGRGEVSLRNIRLEIIPSFFYRGRGAYLVGRVVDEGKAAPLPVALALRHDADGGITLDAVLIGEVDLSILFSYTRAYFRVETKCPYELVRALRELMPRKRLVDLYNAIGYNRHGKTELYRDFVAHLHKSSDCFTFAEGTRGMVMLVFTLPSYDVVFKVIKDQFEFPKDTSRREVMRRYRLVFEHDRAGRLVEAHEFEHLRIARNRFEPGLLKELCRDAASNVRIEADYIVINHAYLERRIRPLNLFLVEASHPARVRAGRDYGQAIKDLAASNIFPGDILTKNFGVTRQGRVVFYDYDELCFLTDCNFRDMPESRTYEEEISAEPWFSVRENDIFPEEFPNFLMLPEPARQVLFEQHGDLFRADFWCAVQTRLRAGDIPEVFPYSLERRLPQCKQG